MLKAVDPALVYSLILVVIGLAGVGFVAFFVAALVRGGLRGRRDRMSGD
jgi:hypothetical protein